MKRRRFEIERGQRDARNRKALLFENHAPRRAAVWAMISFGADVRVFVATQPIDFRKGVHGLIRLVAEGLNGAPYSGDVFVFRSKRPDRLKILTLMEPACG